MPTGLCSATATATATATTAATTTADCIDAKTGVRLTIGSLQDIAEGMPKNSPGEEWLVPRHRVLSPGCRARETEAPHFARRRVCRISASCWRTGGRLHARSGRWLLPTIRILGDCRQRSASAGKVYGGFGWMDYAQMSAKIDFYMEIDKAGNLIATFPIKGGK